jgi:hypothetical protein
LPIQITNSSDGPVLIRLRSGATVHLATGERSPELADSEVRNNPRIEPLLERRLIAVREVAATSRGGRGRGGAAKGRRKGTDR